MGYELEVLEKGDWLSEEVLCLINYVEEGWVDAEMLMDGLLFCHE